MDKNFDSRGFDKATLVISSKSKLLQAIHYMLLFLFIGAALRTTLEWKDQNCWDLLAMTQIAHRSQGDATKLQLQNSE